MSTSTWTTTTSATGMPTLELEPCRIRSSSFRHHRDVSPGASPAGSRSNSPSPSSPTVVLTIPKSRSFSLATPTPMSGSIHNKKLARKSMAPSVSQESNVSSKHSSLLLKTDTDSQDEGDGSNFMKDTQHSSVRTRANITSDYESNDSPSSSDHSDNVVTSEDFVTGSPPNKSLFSSSSIHDDSSTLQKQRVSDDSYRTNQKNTDAI